MVNKTFKTEVLFLHQYPIFFDFYLLEKKTAVCLLMLLKEISALSRLKSWWLTFLIMKTREFLLLTKMLARFRIIFVYVSLWKIIFGSLWTHAVIPFMYSQGYILFGLGVSSKYVNIAWPSMAYVQSTNWRQITKKNSHQMPKCTYKWPYFIFSVIIIDNFICRLLANR